MRLGFLDAHLTPERLELAPLRLQKVGEIGILFFPVSMEFRLLLLNALLLLPAEHLEIIGCRKRRTAQHAGTCQPAGERTKQALSHLPRK